MGPVALGEEDGVPLISSTTQVATGAVAATQSASMTMTMPVAQATAMAVFPGNAPLAPTTKYAVQGSRTDPPSENTPWYPEINEEEQTGFGATSEYHKCQGMGPHIGDYGKIQRAQVDI